MTFEQRQVEVAEIIGQLAVGDRWHAEVPTRDGDGWGLELVTILSWEPAWGDSAGFVKVSAAGGDNVTINVLRLRERVRGADEDAALRAVADGGLNAAMPAGLYRYPIGMDTYATATFYGRRPLPREIPSTGRRLIQVLVKSFNALAWINIEQGDIVMEGERIDDYRTTPRIEVHTLTPLQKQFWKLIGGAPKSDRDLAVWSGKDVATVRTCMANLHRYVWKRPDGVYEYRVGIPGLEKYRTACLAALLRRADAAKKRGDRDGWQKAIAETMTFRGRLAQYVEGVTTYRDAIESI
jgi:hypothetical protein